MSTVFYQLHLIKHQEVCIIYKSLSIGSLLYAVPFKFNKDASLHYSRESLSLSHLLSFPFKKVPARLKISLTVARS